MFQDVEHGQVVHPWPDDLAVSALGATGSGPVLEMLLGAPHDACQSHRWLSRARLSIWMGRLLSPFLRRGPSRSRRGVVIPSAPRHRVTSVRNQGRLPSRSLPHGFQRL